jgi:hypothetical protein
MALSQNLVSRSILFTEKLDRTTPSLLLRNGSVQELQNMRRPSPGIPLGWERRSGSTLYTTNQVASAQIKGLFIYQNSDLEIERFYIQCNDDIYYSGETVPPLAGNSSDITYTKLYDLDSGTSSLFGERINDDIIFAGTGTSPFAHSGASAYPDGFLVKHEAGNTVYVDGYEKVRDKRTDTWIVMPEAAITSGESEFFYVGYRRRLNGMEMKFNNYNQVSKTGSGLSIQTRKNGVWSGVANLVDGTETGNKTFGQDGHISWDNDTSYDPYILDQTKTHLFWYRGFVDTDITNGISTYQVKVSDELEPITNLWSSLYEIPLGCLLSSATGFVDYTGEVTDGTDVNYVDLGSLATTNALYTGFANPSQAIFLRIPAGYENSTQDCVVTISYWNGNNNTWTEISGTTVDGTSGTTTGSAPHISLYQTGMIQWDGTTFQESRRRLGGINTPLYWYKLNWSQDLPSGIRVWEINQAEKPSQIPPFPHYDGVFEYNGRAMFWPGYRFNHGLDFSQEGFPHIFNGPRAGSTGNIFGPGIPNAAARLASYAVISTRDPYRLYLLQGKVPGRFDEYCVSHHVGCVAPHTMVTIEDAIKLFSSAKVVHAVALMAPDGFYMVERTVIKISQPISDYWDTGSTPYIQPEYAKDSYAWIDYKDKTVHFAVPINYLNDSTPQTTLNRELVYNYIADEWYDTYLRSSAMSCAFAMVGWNDQRLTYGGDYSGYIWRLNTGNNDNNNIITHYLKTSDILPLSGIREDVLNYSSTLSGIKTKSLAQTVGDIEIILYPDGHITGVTPVGGNVISMVDSDTFAMGKLQTNRDGESFAIRARSGVSTDELGTNMQIYGITLDAIPRRETQVQ